MLPHFGQRRYVWFWTDDLCIYKGYISEWIVSDDFPNGSAYIFYYSKILNDPMELCIQLSVFRLYDSEDSCNSDLRDLKLNNIGINI